MNHRDFLQPIWRTQILLRRITYNLPLTNGFTLIELLITVSILSLLTAAIIFGATNAARRSQVETAILQINDLKETMYLFRTDTGQWPLAYRSTVGTDPIAHNPFITNRDNNPLWNGPYINHYPDTHVWGGHLGCCGNNTLQTTCARMPIIVFDDDPPAQGFTANVGQISSDVMLEVDRKIDDGNLATGRMVGNGTTHCLMDVPSTACGGGQSMDVCTTQGEFVLRID
ncbi:prepilin-type N-terminal cleavage/methylation domain-containing protein [Candidatus Roizmanbacteria bacterium]|nr:prepilin-type N-terminal cleavage/methylation domain-containing protein [Candidatus Roizmanbacteria bacterium]